MSVTTLMTNLVYSKHWLKIIKFGLYAKAIKIWNHLPLDMKFTQLKWEIVLKFVASLENLNFNNGKTFWGNQNEKQDFNQEISSKRRWKGFATSRLLTIIETDLATRHHHLELEVEDLKKHKAEELRRKERIQKN